jgi:hypothetical protein
MIIMKIDAVNVNAVLKSVNAVLSIYIYFDKTKLIYIYICVCVCVCIYIHTHTLHFASHWDTFRYGNIHKNDSELLSSFMQSGAAEAILYNSVFIWCRCCMYFLKIKLRTHPFNMFLTGQWKCGATPVSRWQTPSVLSMTFATLS